MQYRCTSCGFHCCVANELFLPVVTQNEVYRPTNGADNGSLDFHHQPRDIVTGAPLFHFTSDGVIGL